MTPGQSTFQGSYELCPIILVDGICEGSPNNSLPLIHFMDGPISTLEGVNPNSYFGHFRPMQGSTLIDNQIGDYPFANQKVAANAIISQPLRITIWMDCPANSPGAYQNKQQIMSSLKASLDQHNQAGGTYTIATPSFTYTSCILTALRDVSRPDSAQVQNAWQWEFLKPLLTLEEAEQVYSATMGKINDQLPVNGQPAWSGNQNPSPQSVHLTP